MRTVGGNEVKQWKRITRAASNCQERWKLDEKANEGTLRGATIVEG